MFTKVRFVVVVLYLYCYNSFGSFVFMVCANQTKRNESKVKDSKQQETGVKETEGQETDDNWEVGIRNSLAAK